MILRIGRSIASEIEGVPHGALIFFPQKRFMHACLDAWGVNGVIKTSRGRLQLGGKSLYIEGSTASSNTDVVVRYKRSAVSGKGAVLCCVFRGRNSEGSNFPDRQARGIFLMCSAMIRTPSSKLIFGCQPSTREILLMSAKEQSGSTGRLGT